MEQHLSTADGRIRVRRSAEQILHILQLQRQSSLTVRSYCESNGISEKNFYRWMKKYGTKRTKRQRKNKPTVAKGFAHLTITPPVISSSPFLFAEIGPLRIYKEVPASYLKTLLS